MVLRTQSHPQHPRATALPGPSPTIGLEPAAEPAPGILSVVPDSKTEPSRPPLSSFQPGVDAPSSIPTPTRALPMRLRAAVGPDLRPWLPRTASCVEPCPSPATFPLSLSLSLSAASQDQSRAPGSVLCSVEAQVHLHREAPELPLVASSCSLASPRPTRAAPELLLGRLKLLPARTAAPALERSSSQAPDPHLPLALSRHLFSLLQPSFQWCGCCSQAACGGGSKGARQRQAISLSPTLSPSFTLSSHPSSRCRGG